MESQKHEHGGKKSPWIILGSIFTAAIIAAVGYYWFYSRIYESTDDAFVDGKIISVASQVSGRISGVRISDNQEVKKGDLLVEIDPREYRVKDEQAKAELESAKAQSKRALDDLKRYEQLFAKKQVSEQAYEKAVSDYDIMKAAEDLSAKKLAAAELYLSYTKIFAPENGKITKKSVEEGNYVQTGQPLFAVVTDSLWVTANFKETQLEHIRAGQKVRIKIDAYPGKVFEGRVDSIQSGTGAKFSLMPAENATGNFVKVVQRVPVKIVFEKPVSGYMLAPGMSVIPVVRIK